jgi:hypothetical protein
MGIINTIYTVINKIYKPLPKSFIYILFCEDNKYYVGRTGQWRGMCLDSLDEDKLVLKYMRRFGVDNVRGESVPQINLSEDDKKILRNKY